MTCPSVGRRLRSRNDRFAAPTSGATRSSDRSSDEFFTACVQMLHVCPNATAARVLRHPALTSAVVGVLARVPAVAAALVARCNRPVVPRTGVLA